MRILGIETTCDETAAAVFSGAGLASNVVYSQVKLHKKYKGVVPELASRAHAEKIGEVVKEALRLAARGSRAAKPFDAVAFANGPGLPGALLVGRVAAETVARYYSVPLVGVNHLEGHLLACELASDGKVNPLQFPLIALIVSGGHTELWLAKGYGKYKVLGRTRDDAAGEAFDKVAKLLGLGYPGGPAVENAALKGDPRAISFPRPMSGGGSEFSFSGLKTAVSYYLQEHGKYSKPDVCASFEAAVIDTLCAKALLAAKRHRVRHIAVGGGVAANSLLRRELSRLAVADGIAAKFVEKKFCSDNAAMIALAAYRKLEYSCGAKENVKINPELRVKSWA